MPTYARIAVAKQKIAEKIDALTDEGQFKMTKQVCHDGATTTSRRSHNIETSSPHIYSPTSRPLYTKERLKTFQVLASAAALPSTRQVEAIPGASVSNVAHASKLTPTEEFEKILNEDLEAKTKAEIRRAARWYRWW